MSQPNDPQEPFSLDKSGPAEPAQPYGATPPSDPAPYGSTPDPAYPSAPAYGSAPYGADPATPGGVPGYPAAPGYPTAPPPGPGYGYGSPPPQNYLVWAILSTVLCCLPLGVASIVFAAQVNGKWAAGDVQGAQESARKAKTFAIWSAVAGLVFGLGYLALMIAGVIASDSSSM